MCALELSELLQERGEIKDLEFQVVLVMQRQWAELRVLQICLTGVACL